MHGLIVKHEEHVKVISDKCDAALERMTSAMTEEREKHQSQLRSMMEERDNAVKSAEERVAQCVAEMEQTKAMYEALLEEKRVAEARIKALGGITEDYTSRERFNELEREYNAFTRLYKRQWTKTKQQIKKNHINMENIKAKNEQKGND